MKKGVVEVQMNWILVGIIGVVIIIFFVGIVVKQRDASERKLVSQVTQKLDDIFSGAKAATGGVTEIKIPAFDLTFTCEDFRLGNQRQFLESEVVFGPRWISSEEQRLIVWSLPWKLPYPVTNFLYVTGPQIKYVFVYDDPRYEPFFQETITNKIEKEHRTFSDLAMMEDDNNYKIKIILLEAKPAELPPWIRTREYEIDLVSITDFDPHAVTPAGKILYYAYDKKTNTILTRGTSAYLGISSLIGALFADDAETHSCIMEKAIRNLYVVNKIYIQRTTLLAEEDVCPLFYGRAEMNWFNALDTLSADPAAYKNNVYQFVTAAQELQHRNDLIETQSCPLLY